MKLARFREQNLSTCLVINRTHVKRTTVIDIVFHSFASPPSIRRGLKKLVRANISFLISNVSDEESLLH
jgi:hypothetical protein